MATVRPAPVSPVQPESDPDWLKNANRLHDDVTTQPTALPPFETPNPEPELEHKGYVPGDHPAGTRYNPEADVYDPTFSGEEFPPGSAASILQTRRESEGRTLLTAENVKVGEPYPEVSLIPPVVQRDRKFDDKAIVVNDHKRARPVDPLRPGVLWVALTIAILIFATGGLFSFATIADAALWMMPVWAWLAWVVPGFVEAFVVYFGIDAVINQARGRDQDAESALRWMLVFAGVGVVANAAHTTLAWMETGEIPWQGFIGIAMSAIAPLSVVLITKRVSKLVFLDPSAD